MVRCKVRRIRREQFTTGEIFCILCYIFVTYLLIVFNFYNMPLNICPEDKAYPTEQPYDFHDLCDNTHTQL